VNEPAEIPLPDALREDLYEADALPEVAVLFDPAPEVLEAYALEPSVGVIAVVRGGAVGRRAALELGALEAISEDLEEEEARLRLRIAIERWISRLELEQDREHLAAQTSTLERNLRLAARLQRSFLPVSLPTLDAVQFSTAFLPQEFVSGDSYEIRRLDRRYVAIYTLDAVGHGVRAALLTVLLRAHFEPLGRDGAPRDPAEVLADLNQALLDAHLEDSPTAAFCYGLLDTERGSMRLANAGHPPPLALLPDGRREYLGGSGLLLGVDAIPYSSDEVQLDPGTRVFFFTDGADVGYDEGFAAQLELHRDLELEDQVGGALGAVITLDDEGRPEDDITVVALSYVGATAPADAGARED